MFVFFHLLTTLHHRGAFWVSTAVFGGFPNWTRPLRGACQTNWWGGSCELMAPHWANWLSACAEPDQGVSVANAPSARRWCRLAWSGPRIVCQQAGVLKSHQRCPLGCGHAGLLLGQRQTRLAEAGISLAPSARSSLCGCPSLNSTSSTGPARGRRWMLPTMCRIWLCT